MTKLCFRLKLSVLPCLLYFGCLSLRNYFDGYCDCCPCNPTGCCRSGTVEPENQNETDQPADTNLKTPKSQPTSTEIHEMNKRIAYYERWLKMA